MKHTEGKIEINHLDDIFIESEDGNKIVCTMDDGSDYNTTVADAERIVKTWNSHDELIEALSTAANLLESAREPVHNSIQRSRQNELIVNAEELMRKAICTLK